MNKKEKYENLKKLADGLNVKESAVEDSSSLLDNVKIGGCLKTTDLNNNIAEELPGKTDNSSNKPSAPECYQDEDEDDDCAASSPNDPAELLDSKTTGALGVAAGETVKKKRKRKKKKSKADDAKQVAAGEYPVLSEQSLFNCDALDNSVFRCLGSWSSQNQSRQSFPPAVPIHEVYADENYPVGEIQEYVGNSNSFRMTSGEKRELERLLEGDYKNIRRAAECHRQVRKFAQSYIRPGLSMVDICKRLEQKTLQLIAADGLNCGFGFPTGCSLNNVAAHYTPNYGDDTILTENDICKFDFGVHVAGRIIDCAFTVAFNPKFDQLIKASQDGTNTGLKVAGIDVRFSEIGKAIQETIESYEMVVDGKSIPIKPVSNLNGHTIGQYQIHGGKSLPIIKNDYGERMEENEIYAIETFATTGKGRVVEVGECSHYMKDFEVVGKVPLRLKSAVSLLNTIDQHFGTLAFCRRWLDDLGQQRHLMALKNLVDCGVVEPYPPLADVKGSYVSQMEHTVILRPTCKEIVSRGEDY